MYVSGGDVGSQGDHGPGGRPGSRKSAEGEGPRVLCMWSA